MGTNGQRRGSNNYKRSPRNTHNRKSKNREVNQKILIVCEGKKTEPIYFKEVCKYWGIASAVVVKGNSKPNPSDVVNYAQQLYKKEKERGDPFDKVFCVFDKDQHACFDKAQQQVKKIKPADVFQCICSNPAFEYWFLLHFEKSTKPYQSQNTTAADQVIADLKKHYPNYSKSNSGFFKYTEEEDLLTTALKRSEDIYNKAKTSGEFNPSTQVHELMNVLKSAGSISNKTP